MTRAHFLGRCVGVAAASLAGCSPPTEPAWNGVEPSDRLELHKTEAEWRALLSPAAFAVLFEEWTEPAESSPLTNERRDGIYLCAACLIPLFQSALKYDSDTGWPTFSAALEG